MVALGQGALRTQIAGRATLTVCGHGAARVTATSAINPGNMAEKMRLLVLGAGGVGGYFGGRIAQAGGDVTFLVRGRRRDQLMRDGLHVKSPFGDFATPVRVVTAGELAPDYDLVMLACKAYDLDSAMDAIAPVMTGRCAVLPLLNGMSHLETLDRRFGETNVLGGTAMIASTLAEDGTVVHLNRFHRIAFGERAGRDVGYARAFETMLGSATLVWENSAIIEAELWEKLVALSVLAAATCLFRASVGEIVSAPGGREVMERAIATNVEIATREGHPPRPAALDTLRRMLLDPSSSLTASMMRDLEAGARVEADHIVDWMLDRARLHGLDSSLLSMAYVTLKAYEARRGS